MVNRIGMVVDSLYRKRLERGMLNISHQVEQFYQVFSAEVPYVVHHVLARTSFQLDDIQLSHE